MTVKLFRCRHCGQIIFKVNDTKVPVVCCGEKMAELVANTTDAATEKHVPVVEVNGNVVTVKVGSVTHPMIEEHYIQWILINTNKGVQLKELKPNQAKFRVALHTKNPRAP